MKKNNKKGFTVIELLAVVVVITILIVIAAASVYKVMQQAREKQYETNLDSMETSTRLFADDAKNGLSKVNNALVYKDENGKTWKIGCKKDELGNRTCCISMILLRDLGYLKVTEQDLCAENQKCNDYYANITYIGNNVDTEMLYNTDSCEIVKYEVVYHSVVNIDGTSEGIVKDYCEYNKECKLKSTPDEFKVKYPGHTITGWEDRRGELYDPGASKDFTVKMVSDKLELFAHWKNNEFTFTYHGNGSTSGTMTPSHHVYKDGSSLKSNAFLKTGYSYLGWNDQENGTGRSYANNEPVSDNTFDDGTNINLYAQWEANVYTITYSANNCGTATETTKDVTYDSTYGDLSGFTVKQGYTFTGWFNAASGGNEIKAETQVKTPNNHTLYAHCTPNKYNVTFNKNGGGTPNPTSKKVTYDATYGTLATSSWTGYKLLGWFTAAEGGTEVTASTKVQITADQTLYAHWKYRCKEGFEFKTKDNKCHKIYDATKEACPKGYKDNGKKCVKTSTYSTYVTGYTGGCDWDADGGHMSPSNNQAGCIYKADLPDCSGSNTGEQHKVHDCGAGMHGKINSSGTGYNCSNNNGDRYTYKVYTCKCSGSAIYGCNSGDSQSGSTCTHTESKNYTYKCKDGGTLNSTTKKCEIIEKPIA